MRESDTHPYIFIDWGNTQSLPQKTQTDPLIVLAVLRLRRDCGHQDTVWVLAHRVLLFGPGQDLLGLGLNFLAGFHGCGLDGLAHVGGRHLLLLLLVLLLLAEGGERTDGGADGGEERVVLVSTYTHPY